MQETTAYCPASLSFIFKICPNQNRIKMGSIGIGCTLDKGVTVKVRKSAEMKILFNGKTLQFPTVKSVIEELTSQSMEINISSPLPLGFGFGISSASALATSYAVNKLMHLNKNRLNLAKIVHAAEIKNMTGLGSVATQISGGFLFKSAPGIPVRATRFPFIGQKIYAIVIGRLLTPSVLTNTSLFNKINRAADEALAIIKKTQPISLSQIIDISYRYTQKSGLLTNPKMKSIVGKIKSSDGHATMAMLGEVVISNIKPPEMGNCDIRTLTIGKTVAHIYN